MGGVLPRKDPAGRATPRSLCPQRALAGQTQNLVLSLQIDREPSHQYKDVKVLAIGHSRCHLADEVPKAHPGGCQGVPPWEGELEGRTSCRPAPETQAANLGVYMRILTRVSQNCTLSAEVGQKRPEKKSPHVLDRIL